MSYRGKHRKPSSTGRRIAGAAVAGAIVGAPLMMSVPAQASGLNWDSIAQCESSGNWNANTGNGFSGGLQFTPSTWRAFGGSGSAAQASREQQIAVAERVLAAQGPGAWPVCSKKGGSATAAKSTATTVTKQVTQPVTTKAAPVQASAPAPVQHGNYTVKPGDTLSGIATQAGTNWSDVFAKNQGVVKDANLIFPGEQLNV